MYVYVYHLNMIYNFVKLNSLGKIVFLTNIFYNNYATIIT